jgi:hypothetical protein
MTPHGEAKKSVQRYFDVKSYDQGLKSSFASAMSQNEK